MLGGKQRHRSASQLISFALTAKLFRAFVFTARIVLCFEQKYKNKKNSKSFLLKIFIFYKFKNLCLLHGHVFVMLPQTLAQGNFELIPGSLGIQI